MKLQHATWLTLVLFCFAERPAFAQKAEDFTAIRKEIESLKEGQKSIKDDLAAIRKLLERPAAAAPQAFKEAILSLENSPSKGEKTAPVVLVEFTDYQCPFCARNFRQTYPQLFDEYIKTGKVKYVLRDFPLESIHPQAVKAAEAAHCAAEQGKYWEMHDRLFASQTQLGPEELPKHAAAVGLETGKFSECLLSGRHAAKVRNDMAEAQRIGMTGAPGFYLGLAQPGFKTVKATKNIIGAQPYAKFKEAIDALLLLAPTEKAEIKR